MSRIELKKFEGLNVSSKYAICGLPIRVDTYKTCAFGCKYCFSNYRKIMEFEKELAVANLPSVERRLKRILVDKSYILSAMGLLSKYDADTALKIMKKELLSYGTSK